MSLENSLGSSSESPMEPLTPLEESEDPMVKKRVGKACDRCRMKKTKCDGANPCKRCDKDQAKCVFAEQKKFRERAYPKGYVEMLEAQQVQLIEGLRSLYDRVVNQNGWIGEPLEEAASGHPLTHDILERLGILRREEFDVVVSEEALESIFRKIVEGSTDMMDLSDTTHAQADIILHHEANRLHVGGFDDHDFASTPQDAQHHHSGDDANIESILQSALETDGTSAALTSSLGQLKADPTLSLDDICDFSS
ncbi:MAG: hypothetical protein M1829_002484 [Trizodia sp. TS-e1964]|nr:MAG: hypothetical protein M1829_002484 [Trizodia sp. TS-e1964]